MYNCTVCFKTFKSKQGLTRHVNVHTGEGPKCSVCSKSFPDRSKLQRHEQIHSKETPFKCEICGKQFKANGNLRGHLKTHGTFACGVCGKAFNQVSSQQEHLITHNGPKRLKRKREKHTCGVCGELFTQYVQLRRHLKCHTYIETKDFKCEFCDKLFSKKSKLRVHLKHHTDEMPYETGLRTPKNKHKNKKEIKYSGEKSIECDVCGESITLNDMVQHYSKMHKSTTSNNEMPYNTDTNIRTPTNKKEIKYSGEKSIECDVCGESITLNSIIQHYSKMHKITSSYTTS